MESFVCHECHYRNFFPVDSKQKLTKSSIKWYPWLLADSMVYELGINYMVKQFFHVSEVAVIRILLRNSKREEWSRQLSRPEFKIFIAKKFTPEILHYRWRILSRFNFPMTTLQWILPWIYHGSHKIWPGKLK